MTPDRALLDLISELYATVADARQQAAHWEQTAKEADAEITRLRAELDQLQAQSPSG